MFERNEENHRLVQLLVNTIEFNRGDFVELPAITQVIGFDRTDDRWYTIMNLLKQYLLRTRSIAIRLERGEGIRVLTSESQVFRCSSERRKKMFNQTRYAKKEVAIVNDTDLSDFARIAKAKQLLHFASANAVLKQQIKDDEQSTKTESLPNPKRVG